MDLIARTNERTAERLYQTVLSGRLRPFSEGIAGVQRLVRDTARSLGKQVKLEVIGEKTRIDREILEKLEAPISHLLTNALDHGIETPEARVAAGKDAEAHVRLRARRENGRLVITVRDDGHGITRSALRKKVVQRGLISERNVAALADDELLEFLFLPGFSTKDEVSTTSGRGVGTERGAVDGAGSRWRCDGDERRRRRHGVSADAAGDAVDAEGDSRAERRRSVMRYRWCVSTA